jgi:hypothetical protein
MKEGNALKHRLLIVIIGCCFILLAIPLGGSAQSEKDVDPFEPLHYMRLFVGGTYEDDDTGFSMGGEYEYRFRKLFGLGPMAEYTAGVFDSWVLGVPFILHPHDGWVLLAAPGVEIADGETEFLFRIGGAYEFEVGEKLSIAPEINIDFTEGEQKFVFGLAFGLEL